MKDLILPPSYGNRLHYPWLLIFRRGGEWGPPYYFLSHGRNYSKWDTPQKRSEGFQINGHIKERDDATYVVKKLNRELRKKFGENAYQTTEAKNGIDWKRMKQTKGTDNG